MLDATDLLTSAVAIPSVSGQEADVARYLAAQMARFCDEAFVDASGSAVARLGTGPLHVTFLGHIDTVPGAIPVRVEDGKLYGRGSVDAKGPFCAAVAAASRLRPKVLERLSLRLIGATEEEAPSSKGARFATAHYEKPDLLIIGEPSGWDALTLGYKGRLVLSARVEKENFHSAGDGSTAAEDMVALWLRLKGHADDYNAGVSGLFDALQLSLQAISSSSDGLEQCAEATFGYRLPPALSPEGLQDRVSSLALGAQLEFKGAEQPYRAPKDTVLTRALRVAIRAQGASPRFKVKTGTSDMNVVAPLWDVPMLAYGPGDSALDHTANEHLVLEDYDKAVTVLVTALEHLASTT